MQISDDDIDDIDFGSETGEAEDATPSQPPSDDDDGDELHDIVAEAAQEAAGDDDGYSRDELGRFAKKEGEAGETDGSQTDDAENAVDADSADDVQSELPEHMAEWSEDQLAAYEALPDEAKAYLSDPQGVVKYVEENVRSQMQQQYEPMLQQLEPIMQVLQDTQTSDYLARRQHELGMSQEDIISRVLQTDAFLTYAPNTQARHQAAMQLLQSYGIDPVEMVLGAEGGGQNYQQNDLQQQLAAERWQRERMQMQMQQQVGQQTQQNVEAFASQVGSDGQPLRPMMGNPSVRASMGHLIASGQAHSLDHAYQMAVAPLEAEISQRAQYLAQQQAAQAAQSRQKAVRRSARARPVRVNTAQHGGTKDGQTIEDIVGGVVSEMM